MDESIAIYSMRKVNRAVAIISMVIAAILLVVSIVVLYFVTNSDARLGLISAFTILFALSIHLLTNAQRGELFASAAAYVPEDLFLAIMLIIYYSYAAVLVVFVSGNLGSSSCSMPCSPN